MINAPLSSVSYADVLAFWFSPEVKPLWFAKDPVFDQLITDRFGATYEQAARGALNQWSEDTRGMVALVIVLDQFPRNMFRGHAKSYATDALALRFTKKALKDEMDQGLSEAYKQFLYMPLMHSEQLADQERSVALFQFDPQAALYARRHLDMIKQFGRFPHRNEVLGRASTAEELHFLTLPNTTF